MTKKPALKRKPQLKQTPEQPHVEVRDQTGALVPVAEIIIEEDAKGVFLIRVKVHLPQSALFRNYVSSGHNTIL